MLPPPGCTPTDPFFGPRPTRAFVQGEPGNDRLRVEYFRREADNALVATAWFGPGAEGPPRRAHGGAVAAVLDEVMGTAAWHAGHPVVVARLTIDMRAMIPLPSDTIVETEVVSINGRKIVTRGRMTAGDTLLAEGEALCVTLTQEQIAVLIGESAG